MWAEEDFPPLVACDDFRNTQNVSIYSLLIEILNLVSVMNLLPRFSLHFALMFDFLALVACNRSVRKLFVL